MGLKAHQLTSQELIRLFFDIYNPESGNIQMAESSQYKTPLVKATLRLKGGNEKISQDSTIHNQINNLVSQQTVK